MKFTDEKAIAILKRVGICELDEAIDDYPEQERDGRSDMQMLADETSLILSLFSEDTSHRDDLEWAKEIINKSRRKGAAFSGFVKVSDLQTAKNVLNEHRRLVNLESRLRKMGYRGKWM